MVRFSPLYELLHKLNPFKTEMASELIAHSSHVQRSITASLQHHLSSKDNVVLSATEWDIVLKIRSLTAVRNRTNVTRTQAYIDFFKQHPEIHWAFLAHMVSRNGGWNMTDLKGEPLSHILTKKEATHYFLFLERCNWLIFQDAYPQLLLYAESEKRKTPLFHLLPHFSVSVFMRAVWEQFWNTKDSKTLSYGLIVNEQNYIEQRVVQNEHYKKTVLETIKFKAQALLDMNYVLFPSYDDDGILLYGTIVRHFDHLKERIRIGKMLYAILYQNGELNSPIAKWAYQTTHSASRTDYWPSVFSKNKVHAGKPYIPRLHECELKDTCVPLYSPTLEQAWPEIVAPAPAGEKDWCRDIRIVRLLKGDERERNIDISDEYCDMLATLEAVAALGEAL